MRCSHLQRCWNQIFITPHVALGSRPRPQRCETGAADSPPGSARGPSPERSKRKSESATFSGHATPRGPGRGGRRWARPAPTAGRCAPPRRFDPRGLARRGFPCAPASRCPEDHHHLSPARRAEPHGARARSGGQPGARSSPPGVSGRCRSRPRVLGSVGAGSPPPGSPDGPTRAAQCAASAPRRSAEWRGPETVRGVVRRRSARPPARPPPGAGVTALRPRQRPPPCPYLSPLRSRVRSRFPWRLHPSPLLRSFGSPPTAPSGLTWHSAPKAAAPRLRPPLPLGGPTDSVSQRRGARGGGGASLRKWRHPGPAPRGADRTRARSLWRLIEPNLVVRIPLSPPQLYFYKSGFEKWRLRCLTSDRKTSPGRY